MYSMRALALVIEMDPHKDKETLGCGFNSHPGQSFLCFCMGLLPILGLVGEMLNLLSLSLLTTNVLYSVHVASQTGHDSVLWVTVACWPPFPLWGRTTVSNFLIVPFPK